MHITWAGRLEAWAILPNGRREALITVPEWDIDRQSVYRYRKPMLLPAETVVHMHYVYDNSAENVHNPHSPPVRVVAGNRSEDEMAHLWLQVLPVHTVVGGPDPRLMLEEAWMRRRLEKEPGDAIAQYDLAAALAGERRFGEAIAAYEQLLAAHPGDARALNSLGATLESKGDWQHALLSQVLAGTGELQEAIAEEKAALALDARDADGWNNLGVLEARSGLAAEAREDFRHALVLAPDHGRRVRILSICRRDKGRACTLGVSTTLRHRQHQRRR